MFVNSPGSDIRKQDSTFEVMDAHLSQEVEIQAPLRK